MDKKIVCIKTNILLFVSRTCYDLSNRLESKIESDLFDAAQCYVMVISFWSDLSCSILTHILSILWNVTLGEYGLTSFRFRGIFFSKTAKVLSGSHFLQKSSISIMIFVTVGIHTKRMLQILITFHQPLLVLVHEFAKKIKTILIGRNVWAKLNHALNQFGG